MGFCFWILTLGALAVSVFVGLLTTGLLNIEATLPPARDDIWWSKSKKPDSEDTSVNKFVIDVPDSRIKDLKERLSKFTPAAPLVDAKFNYGFNSDYLSNTIIPYWRDKYNWKNQQSELNKFPQFKTSINGLQIHFVHVKPSTSKYTDPSKVKKLLLIHGWPGSVYEFYKMLPMLTDPLSHGGRADDVFEVVCPSIPGYGFSDPPQIQGFDAQSAAHVFAKLMSRLGMSEYYVQGGDWGSIISLIMTHYHKESILGVHTNMLTPPNKNLDYALRLGVGALLPSLILPDPTDQQKVYPFIERMIDLLAETGYLHIQATKPDTVGAALQDSPAGLAAYILEKFSTWTDAGAGRGSEDGGLTRWYSLDELLTSVMMYWAPQCVTSSLRFYRENVYSNAIDKFANIKVTVPAGYAAFPQELVLVPRDWAERYRFTRLVHYTEMPSGGHFAAFQVPDLLAADIRKFVRTVEESKLYFAGHFSGTS